MADKSNATGEISSKEFQHKLVDWFDKRGLLSELRAFMRHRMISALYDSESPCPAPHFSSHTSVSPTLQAILLLVAEFLVQQEYHYTMSVMVAEVPLLASFPKFSNYVSYMSHTDPCSPQKCGDFPRYTEKDVQEILNVLGLATASESTKHILRLYSNNSARESLLACVLTALSAIVQHFPDKSTKDDTSELWAKKTDNLPESTRWVEEIRLVLLRAQLTSVQLHQVEELLRKLYTETADKIRWQEKEKHTQFQHSREQQLLADTLLREEKFRAQMQEAEEDLRIKQTHLEQVTSQLRQQHDEVLCRLNRVQRHADEIRKQENELNRKEKELELKEKAHEKQQAIIREEHETLAGLRAELQEAAHSIRQEHSDNKTLLELNRLQERCLHLEAELKEAKNQLCVSAVVCTEIGIQATEGGNLQEELPEDNTVSPLYQKSPGSSISSSTSHSKLSFEKSKGKIEQKEKNNQVTLLKKVLCRVQQENTELKANSAQQRRRIDELTARAAQLALHIADQAGNSVQFQAENLVSDTQVSQQQPQAPPLPPRHVRLGGQIGTGGDLSQGIPRHSPATSAHTVRSQGREWRRKPTKRLMQHSSLTTSLSSDESPTEEVLREARNRLKRLEEESEAVDRSYRDFRARQADNLAATTPILFVPTHHASVDTAMTQTSQEIHTLSVAEPISPSLMRSNHFPSPDAAVYRSSTLPPSLYSGATSRFSSNSLSFPRSQFTYPERPFLAPPRTDISSKLSQSLPYHSSELRRPVDRFRNLLGGRPTLRREFSTRDEGTQSDIGKVRSASPEPNQDATTGISDHPDPANSHASRAADGFQKMILRSPSEKLVDYESGKEKATENSTENFLSRKSSFVLKYSQEISPQSPSLKEKLPESLNSFQQMVGEIETAPQPPERNQSLSSSNIDDGADNQLPPMHIRNDEANKQLPTQQPVQSAIVDQIESAHYNFEKPVGKSSVIDATLNEISTLSSSPGLSVVNERNGTITSVMETIPPLQDLKGVKSHLTYQIPTDVRKKLFNSELSPQKLSTTPKTQNESRISDEANQLLNTSLSSIEKTDQQLSAGSAGKKSDEDDDFW